MKVDKVNLDIRRHEEKDYTEWEYSERAKDLYTFFDLFNRRFFSEQLPIPVISFRPGRVTSLGWYLLGRNEVGVKDQINLNARHLGLPRYVTLATLLHEMAHQWQDYFGKHGGGCYHNKQFQEKPENLGYLLIRWVILSVLQIPLLSSAKVMELISRKKEIPLSHPSDRLADRSYASTIVAVRISGRRRESGQDASSVAENLSLQQIGNALN